METKKNILLFNLAVDEDDPIVGFAVGLIGRIAREAASVSVITVRMGRYQLPKNVSVYSVGRELGRGRVASIFVFYKHLFALLRNGGVDICFSHMNQLFVVLAAPFLVVRRIPIFLWYAHRRPTVMVWLASFFAKYTLMSTYDSYIPFMKKAVITGQMIDTDFFKPCGEIIKNDPPLFISVGRISPIKDVLTFVRAAHIMRSAGYAFKCAYIGPVLPHDAHYFAAVRGEAARLGLEDIFIFSGSAYRDDVRSAYQRAFAHINACSAGAPDKAALEAMACGTLSVFANRAFVPLAGVFSEALYFTEGDPQSLAAILMGLLSMEASKKAALSHALRDEVLHRHSMNSFIRHFNRLIA